MASIKLPNLYSTEARPIPVDDKGASSSVVPITGETVQLIYYDGNGAQQTDVGQAAGTVVVGKLANDNIRNELGGMQATAKGSVIDTSLSFTSTALTTEVYFDWTKEAWDEYGAKERAVNITLSLANGEFVFDPKGGYIYGKKADTSTTLTSTSYKIPSNSSSTSGDVNVAEIGGTTINVNGGNRDAGTQTVTLANNDPVVTALAAGTPQALATKATGTDAYATVITPSADAKHIDITLAGSPHGAIISLDGGTTDHIYMPSNTGKVLDNIEITNGTAIQAKNLTAGQDYTNLYISIW